MDDDIEAEQKHPNLPNLAHAAFNKLAAGRRQRPDKRPAVAAGIGQPQAGASTGGAELRAQRTRVPTKRYM